MDESIPYFDPIEREEERLRLWSLFHQYPTQKDHRYRILIVRKVAVLHGGYRKLPKLNERQKTILELYYDRNVSDAGIGVRLGIREVIIRRERLAALQALEDPVVSHEIPQKVVPLHTAKIAVQPEIQRPQQVSALPQKMSFWQEYDAAHYGRQQALAAEHFRDVELLALDILFNDECIVLDQSYKQRISVFEIAMRNGWPEYKARELKKSGVQKIRALEKTQQTDSVSLEVSSSVPCAPSVRMSPQSLIIPDTAIVFWDQYDSEGSWRRKREMLRSYLNAFPLDASVQLNSREHLVVQELIVERKDMSSIARINPQLKKFTIVQSFKRILDALRIRDGVAPLYRKTVRVTKRVVVSSSPPRKLKKTKADYEGEKMLAMFLADRTNQKLKDQLVLEWMPLVHYVIKKKVYTDLAKFQYDDYVSMGTIGLLEAIEKYDPHDPRHASFKTYALNRIAFAMQNGSKQELGLRNAFARMEGLEAELKEIEKREKEETLDEETLRRRKYLQVRIGIITNVVKSDSLDRPIGYQKDGGLAICIGDMVAHPLSTDEHVEIEMSLEILSSYIHILSEQEQLTLYLVFYEEMAPASISKKLGMAPRGVQMVLDRALSKLKKALLSSGIVPEKNDDYLSGHDEEYRSVLELLTSKQRAALLYREEDGLTLEEAGRRMGLTRERVRQLEVQARRRITACLGRPKR